MKESVCSLIRDLVGLVDQNGVLTSFGQLSQVFALEFVLCHTNTSLCSLIAGTLLLVFPEARGIIQLWLHRWSVTMWLSHRLRWCLTSLSLCAASGLFSLFFCFGGVQGLQWILKSYRIFVLLPTQIFSQPVLPPASTLNVFVVVRKHSQWKNDDLLRHKS